MKAKDLEKIVIKQGFRPVKGAGKGGHKKYKNDTGKMIIVPFHSGDIKPGTLRAIFKQIGYKEARK
ncbi:type II toxin-antitoxin system HicA family toxin (plasmid) [Oenococcus alcoholitolerans]|uniref:Toxin HicA n=1 Tax=Oenococcus alcoholitolerans TaxID=931074 RepID=A0ABR4XUB5_9LACO|nr:hypothetical protein Q757_00400 [Oenococcus alcoholitolerans]